MKFWKKCCEQLSRCDFQWKRVLWHISDDWSFYEKKKKTYVIYQNHSLSIMNDNNEEHYIQISIQKHVLIDETLLKVSEMNTSVQKTSQSKILDQFSMSKITSFRSSSKLIKNVQTFNEFNFMFNKSNFMFDELISNWIKTFVAIKISKKKETINLSRKNQSMNKEINIFS